MPYVFVVITATTLLAKLLAMVLATMLTTVLQQCWRPTYINDNCVLMAFLLMTYHFLSVTNASKYFIHKKYDPIEWVDWVELTGLPAHENTPAEKLQNPWPAEINKPAHRNIYCSIASKVGKRLEFYTSETFLVCHIKVFAK